MTVAPGDAPGADPPIQGRLRGLPSVDRLLQADAVRILMASHPRSVVVEVIQDALRTLRARLLSHDEPVPAMVDDRIIQAALDTMRERSRPSLRRVVNATGVVIHTNLGRAPLCPEAVQALTASAGSYLSLEMDMESGRRGRRAGGLLDLVCELTGAEAACLVNNNAAAVLLVLDALARGREVVVSRSELIEIGGSFRLPDVLGRSGARLVEVGTTNRTYVTDYEAAVGDQTALLLKSHPSNYRIVGYTHEVTAGDLADLGRRMAVPTFMDLGSGVLVDLRRWGLPAEPTVGDCVASGLDLVSFSGDKLLGGPQVGVIVGRRDLVARCAASPLWRALRCDRLTLVALEATLATYRDPRRLPEVLPVLGMLTRPEGLLEVEAKALAASIREAMGAKAAVSCDRGTSVTGGGALPACEIPTWLVRIGLPSSFLAEGAAWLRAWDPPVVVRTGDDHLLLDVRTLLPGDAPVVVQACHGLAGRLG